MEGELRGKKLRKPYTITRPRDRWTSEEHDRFLEALLIFGRDWKKIEDFVGTKTTIQEISYCCLSHAQKYFLKVQKVGLASHVPPPHSKRKTGPHHQSQSSSNNDILQSVSLPMGPTSFLNSYNAWDPPNSTCSSNNNSTYYAQNDAQAFADCFSMVPQIIEGKVNPVGSANLYDQSLNWAINSSQNLNFPQVPSISDPLPSLPVEPNFSQVCSFIGNMFDPETTRPLQIYYEKLKQFDPATTRAILAIIGNLTTNLSSSDFEPLGRWFSTYNPQTKTIGAPLLDRRWKQEYEGYKQIMATQSNNINYSFLNNTPKKENI
ncbi:hypothetical protein LUZ60_009557 [Juncus effusus]|nr:hypothetical protein LUZ60_009557 [Juncus effusus]